MIGKSNTTARWKWDAGAEEGAFAMITGTRAIKEILWPFETVERERSFSSSGVGFGSVAGRCGPSPSPKPCQNSKIPASNGHRISLSALKLTYGEID